MEVGDFAVLFSSLREFDTRILAVARIGNQLINGFRI